MRKYIVLVIFFVIIGSALVATIISIAQPNPLEHQIEVLINSSRVERQFLPLADDYGLTNLARAKAKDMAGRGYFADKDPNGLNIFQSHPTTADQGQYSRITEVIEVGYSDAPSFVSAFVSSDTAYQDVLNSQYSLMGVGVAKGVWHGKVTYFVAVLLGAPKATPEFVL